MTVLVWGLVGLVGLFAVLFVRPDVPWSALRQRFGLPESRYIPLESGVEVHAIDVGPRDAPVLVLLHGFGASVHTWASWIERLRSTMRVVALDLKGFGLTSAPADSPMDEVSQVRMVRDTLLKLGVQRFALLGHSMGGGFAWRYALDHPEQLTALILSGAMGPVPKGYGRNLDVYQRLARNPIVRAAVPWLMSKFMIARGMLAGFVNTALATPARVERAEQLARGPNQRKLLLSMVSSMRPGAGSERIADIRTPTLIMHGTEDALVPLAAGQLLADTIPGAKILVYENVGHVLQEEVPDRAADDLAAFLQSVWASEGRTGTPSPS